MTVKQWKLTLLVLLISALFGLMISGGDIYFGATAGISLIALLAVLKISNSKTSITLALLELAAMTVIFLSWLSYNNSIESPYWFINLETWIYTIIIMQILTMLIGFPHGLRRTSKHVGVGHILHHPVRESSRGYRQSDLAED